MLVFAIAILRIIYFIAKFSNIFYNVESSGKCKISDLPEENILWAVEIQC